MADPKMSFGFVLYSLSLSRIPIPFVADVDYVPVDTTLTFSEDVTTISFNVTLINDGFVEGDETFQMRLAIITQGANIMFFPADNAPVTILDDDSKT